MVSVANASATLRRCSPSLPKLGYQNPEGTSFVEQHFQVLPRTMEPTGRLALLATLKQTPSGTLQSLTTGEEDISTIN